MKKLFIYFSASGNGDYLAELMSKQGYTPIKVEMVKPIKKIGFFTILHFGGRATFSKCEKIKPLNLSIEKGDDIVIGSPIWADKISTPINTVLKTLSLNKNSTEFIFYPAGEGTKKSLKQVQKMGFILEPHIISNPLKNKEKAEQLVKENF